jgi:hypothetical protein
MTAPAKSPGRGDLKSTTYEFFILAISILSIANMVLIAVLQYQSQSWWLVVYVDSALTAIFLGDFIFRLTTAPTRRSYLVKNGGIFDLLGCLPGLRIFRLFRIVRAIRVIRRLGGPKVVRELRGALASGTLYLVVFLGLATLEYIGLLELHFEEHAKDANITTAGDTLWWGYVTATTVGYGDQFPVTIGGRMAGVLMLTLGVALFATFSGFLANFFLSSGRKEEKAAAADAATASARADAATASATADAAAGSDAATDLRTTLRQVERLHAEQADALEKLRAQVAALDPAT